MIYWKSHSVSTTHREHVARDERLARYAPDFLLGLYERMTAIRQFEEGVKFLFLEGIMPGTIHQCQGQEATAVGVCAALRRERLHHIHLPRARARAGQRANDAGTPQGVVRFHCRLLRGKGGSMHVGNMAKGMVPGIAIVAGGIPVAAGMALAFKCKRPTQVVACFFGDGAVAEGAFHEGVNMAAIWNLPVLFVCENNLYGASTHVSKVMRDTNIARRGSSLRHSRATGRRQRRVGGLRSGGSCREGVPGRCGSGAAGTVDLSPHRPLAPRPLPLPTEGGTRGLGRARPHRTIGTMLEEPGSRRHCRGWRPVKAGVQQRFQQAVDEAKRLPLPTLEDLTTDVLVP